MSKEVSNFLSVPEFEKQCDDFVLRVTNEVVNDYPELGIHPINRTRDDLLNIGPKSIAFSEKKHGRKANLLRWFYQKLDERSAHESEGVVDIYGWEGWDSISKIVEASLKIDKIAKDCGGEKGIFGSEEESLSDPNLPSIHLVYSFK